MDEDLVEAIASHLRREGSAQSHPCTKPAPWRAAARAAARTLGRPVQTLELNGIAHAFLRDWPANDLERQIEARAQRRAIDSLGT